MALPSRPLDRIDAEILAHLRKDARLSNKELAGRVGLAPSTCLVRTQRLIEEGVLRGFHADVAPEALGLGLQAMISVRLSGHDREAIVAFREHVMALDEVLEVFYVGGSEDFLVRVAVRDTEHLRVLVLDGITADQPVRHIETAILFEHQRKWDLGELGRIE